MKMNPDVMKEKLASLIKRYGRSPEFLFANLTGPNQPGLTGDTLLHAAVIRAALEDVDTLVELGAEVNMKGDLGNPPLHHAASRGNVEIVSKLLGYGADASVKNEFGQTPGDLATLMKHSDVAILLKKRIKKSAK